MIQTVNDNGIAITTIGMTDSSSFVFNIIQTKNRDGIAIISIGVMFIYYIISRARCQELSVREALTSCAGILYTSQYNTRTIRSNHLCI